MKKSSIKFLQRASIRASITTNFYQRQTNGDKINTKELKLSDEKIVLSKAQKMKQDGISVFFPAYNDGETIGRIVEGAVLVLRPLGVEYEIIIVNDGSTDNTQQVISDLAKGNNRVRVIHHLRNRGYGEALRSGFAASSKGLVFYTDSDGQYDIKELPLLLSAMEDGVDMVNGYKIHRSDSQIRIILGKIYQRIVKIAFNLKLNDVTCDFRLFRRNVFEKIKLESRSGAICVEMTKKIMDGGFLTKEVPVHHYPRKYGYSQFFTLVNLVKTILELIRLWLKEALKTSKKCHFNADLRKSNADKRRFVIGTICDHLRYICDHLRSKKVFRCLF